MNHTVDAIERLDMANQVDSLTRDHVLARISDWSRRLNELFARIESGARGMDDVAILYGSIQQTREELMVKFHVEPVELPTLAVMQSRIRVSFVPLALWVIGANVRVNITTNSHTYILIDESEYGPPAQWVVINPARRNDRIPFDDGIVRRLVRDEALFE